MIYNFSESIGYYEINFVNSFSGEKLLGEKIIFCWSIIPNFHSLLVHILRFYTSFTHVSVKNLILWPLWKIST